MVQQLTLANVGGVAKLFRVGLVVQILRLRSRIRKACRACACPLMKIGAAGIDAIEKAIPEVVGVVRRLHAGSLAGLRQCKSVVCVEESRYKSEGKRIARESPAGDGHEELL